jgi:hypothetical protein
MRLALLGVVLMSGACAVEGGTDDPRPIVTEMPDAGPPPTVADCDEAINDVGDTLPFHDVAEAGNGELNLSCEDEPVLGTVEGASYRWTAPATGMYAFTTSPEAMIRVTDAHTCGTTCEAGVSEPTINLPLKEGQKVVVLVQVGQPIEITASCPAPEVSFSSVPAVLTSFDGPVDDDYARAECEHHVSGDDTIVHFTAPATGRYDVAAAGGELFFFDPSCEDPDAHRQCLDEGRTVLDLTAGETIGIAVEGSLPFTIRDHCPAAEVDLGSALPLSVSGTTAGAGDEWSTCLAYRATEVAGDVIYAWTAPAAGTYRVAVTSSFPPVLGVSVDGCLGDSTSCADQTETTVTVGAGAVLTIGVDSEVSSEGDFTLTIDEL